MNKDIKRIKSWKPCKEVLKWAKKKSSLKKVWGKCKYASWLFFICDAEPKLNLKKEQSVAIAIAVASRVLNKFEAVCLDDKRPRKAIEAAQAWLDNPTEENAVAADCAAVALNAYAAAAYAAYAADDVTKNAAYSAANAALAAAAAAAAANPAYAADAAAAYAAAYAADAAANAADAFAADATERKAQVDIFRSIVPNPFKQQTKE